MTKYIHVSTTPGPIGMDGNVMSIGASVDLCSLPVRGPRVNREITFEIEHTCTGPTLGDDFAALAAKVKARGDEIAQAFITANADQSDKDGKSEEPAAPWPWTDFKRKTLVGSFHTLERIAGGQHDEVSLEVHVEDRFDPTIRLLNW